MKKIYKLTNQGGESGSARKLVFLVMVCVFMVGMHTANAQTLYVTSGGSVTEQNTEVYIAGDAAVTSGSTPLTGATASIVAGFSSDQDILGIDGNTSGTDGSIDYSYNSGTGVLTLTNAASASDYQATLRKITYSNSSATPSTGNRTITISLNSALPFSGNGHFYEFISDNGIAWSTAKTTAEGTTYFGLQGYLATVTSSEENTFCHNKLSGSGWIGASDAASEGVWKWVCGPESGTQFWQGSSSGNTVNSMFAYWNGGEPNNCCSGEHYAHFWEDGTWNDLPDNGGVAGYLIEYGGMTGDPTIHISDNVTVTFPAPANPGGITGTTPICNGNSTSLTASGVVGTVYWYTGSCGGTFVESGTNPLSVTPTGNTTYYARNYRYTQYSTGCATLSIVVNPAPTLADIDITGTSIKWYSASTGGTELPANTPLVNGTTYYASQTVNGLESTERLPVAVVVGNQ